MAEGQEQARIVCGGLDSVGILGFMALFFEVTQGKNKGDKFKLKHGVRVGRARGEIRLNDPKISALHAHIEKEADGELYLIDLDSSNGIKIDGIRVKRAKLVAGLELQLGRTLLTVFEGSPELEVTPPPVPVPPNNWIYTLKEELTDVSLQNRPPQQLISAFLKPLQLTFLEGCQADLILTLGYGPRQAGSDVLDIDLHEESAPPKAFELSPAEDGALFSTDYPQLVRLNEVSTSSQTLHHGDLIRVGKTLIRVEFL